MGIYLDLFVAISQIEQKDKGGIMTDNAVVGFLLCKLYKERCKELEQENKTLIDFIKEKMPEYKEWLDLSFNGGKNGTERDN